VIPLQLLSIPGLEPNKPSSPALTLITVEIVESEAKMIGTEILFNMSRGFSPSSFYISFLLARLTRILFIDY